MRYKASRFFLLKGCFLELVMVVLSDKRRVLKMSSKKELTGKNAMLAWNRVGTILEESGVSDHRDLSERIVSDLVSRKLIEGDFFIPGRHYDTTINLAKLHPNAVVPAFATDGDAGADLYSVEELTLAPYQKALVGTGIAIALPKGKVGLIHPRSGLAAKHGVTVLNTPGTIDSGYRGEIKVILFNSSDEEFRISVGDRIAQLVVQNYDSVLFYEVDSLDETSRGTGGFGSTGRK